MRRAGAVLVAMSALTAAAVAGHGPRPDLEVTHLEGAPASVRQGQTFTVTDRVKNRGRRLAGHSRVGFFLVRRKGGLTLRVRLGERRVPALRAGHRSAGTTRLTVPAIVADGRWRLVACADRTHRVKEGDEGDNCRTAKRTTRVLPARTRPRPTPPAAVTLTSPAAGALIASRKPALAGTADPRAPVAVLIYAGSTATGSPARALTFEPAPNGSWSGPPAQPLADGTYTARARQGSGAALRVSAPHTFVVDATAPAVTVTAPADGATTNLMTLGGSAGTAPRDGGTVAIRLYAGTDTSGAALQSFHDSAAGGDWSALALPVPPGEYTVVAEQDDAAGNHGRDSATFTVPVSLLAAGDIATCDRSGDEETAALLPLRSGAIALLGDNAYEDGSADQYANCYAPSWGPFLDRTHPAPGNREYHVAGAAGYFGYFGQAAGAPGEGYYSYDLGAWHVVALNTSNNCSPVACAVGSPQEQWLRSDLAAHPAQCTLAYFHHPQFSSYLGTNDAVRPLWQALRDFGADVVLNGHAHNYERYAPQTPTGGLDSVNGIREFVVGTGGHSHHGFPADVDSNSEVRDDVTFGILDLTLDDAGYSWRFVPAAGGTFTDSGTDNCH